MTKRSHQNESITGRDDYIISQALVYAAGHIQRMPSERQEWSNMADMCQIARTLFPGWLELHVVHFFRAMDFLIDMFPDQDADQTLKAEFENTTRNLINQFDKPD